MEDKTLQTQDTVKEEAVQEGNAEPTHTRKTYIPRVNIYEGNEDIVVVADMPGVDENSIDITLEKNVLTIHGEVEPIAPDNYTLSYAEYGIGDYHRTFTLSNAIDQENIQATVSNGVLNLRLPKTQNTKARKILVRAT